MSSPEGWEPGALNLAQGLAMKFRTQSIHGDVTRLLIDLSKDGDARWSRFSKKLPEAARAKLVERHENPYRLTLNDRIADALQRHATVTHLMINTDSKSTGQIFLKTPANSPLAESFAKAWNQKLRAAGLNSQHLSVVAPSQLGASLMKAFPAAKYAQIRLSVSQSFFLENRPLRWDLLKKQLGDALSSLIAEQG
ncbi:MAG: hypothetical protein HC767_07395 [Akkermansiaceae bacterium]|nr:hypothetical protein [Akkermansiaceae bacterium]